MTKIKFCPMCGKSDGFLLYDKASDLYDCTHCSLEVYILEPFNPLQGGLRAHGLPAKRKEKADAK